MSRSRGWSALMVAAAVLAAAAPAAGPAAAQEVLLAWQFRPGDVDVYLMTQTGRTGGPMGEVVQKQTTRARQEVLRVAPDGVADLRVTYEAIRAEHDGPDGARTYDSDAADAATDPGMKLLASMVGASFEMTIAPNGEVRRISGIEDFLDRVMAAVVEESPEAAGEVRAMLESMFDRERMEGQMQQNMHALPAGPVAPGAEWSTDFTLDLPFGTARTIHNYRLDEVVTRDGRRVARIELTGSMGELEMAGDSPMAALLEQLEVSGGDVVGIIEFDIDLGRLVRMSTTTAMTMAVMGMTMDVVSAQQMERIDG